MPEALRRFATARGATGLPLRAIVDHVRAHGPLDAAAARALADSLNMPDAAVRSAASFYDGTEPNAQQPRPCSGTSCRLRGGPEVGEGAPHAVNGKGRDGIGRAYCLGYCDRSPVAARADGTVVAASSAKAIGQRPSVDPSPADVRCLARKPIALERVIRGDHSRLEEARAAGAYQALEGALEQLPSDVLWAVAQSGVRGRGGAGFPTGTKWQAAAGTPAPRRYVVANGGEGDPGSFVDRVLMERDPHAVLEGMALCGFAIGADKGVVYIRSDYPRAMAIMRRAIDEARAAGFLGGAIGGGEFSFDVEVFEGLGGYVCGEETALIRALEGLRGEIDLRPPYPAQAGLRGRPTVVNNVETLVNVPWIIRQGPEAYASLGTADSPGTKVLSLNAGFARPGLVEVAFGTRLNKVIQEAGAGADDKPLAAVLLGGAMGSVLTPEQWSLPICYTAMGRDDVQLGHGGLLALPADTNVRMLVAHWLRFLAGQSCGKCVPCRLGSRHALAMAQSEQPDSADRLSRTLEVIAEGSLCAFGQLTPGPIQRLLELQAQGVFAASSDPGRDPAASLAGAQGGAR